MRKVDCQMSSYCQRWHASFFAICKATFYRKLDILKKIKYEENYKNKENITCDITNIVLVLVRSMAQFSRFCSTDTALVVAIFVLLEEQRLHLGPGLVVGPRVCCDGDLRGVGLPNRKILWKTSYYNMFSKFKHAITKVSRSVTASCYILYAFTKWTVNLCQTKGDVVIEGDISVCLEDLLVWPVRACNLQFFSFFCA